MPRLHVVAVAAKLPAWAQEACAGYERRMPRGYEFSRTNVKAGKLSSSLKGRVIALDERGRDLTTAQFAELLKTEATFVIGGPDGLGEEVKKRAAVLVRLSSLTLPHALAQVVLVEQIYRAATLLTGHPYHRA